MKKIFTLICCLLIATTATMAQSKFRNRNKLASQFLRVYNDQTKEKQDEKEQRIKKIKSFFFQEHPIKTDKQILKKLDEYTSSWEDENVWSYDKEVYTYNSQGYLIEEIDYDRNEPTSDWSLSGKTIFSYNENGLPLEFFRYKWLESNEVWQNSCKVIAQYNINGKPSEVIRLEDWNSELEAWGNFFKETFTYNSNGNRVEEIQYNWDEGSDTWQASSRETYTYNTSGYLTEELEYFWSSGLNSWLANKKSVYTYNESDNVTQILESYWEESQWIPSYKETTTYNESGYVSEYISFTWVGTDWEQEYKVEYSCNSSGKVIERVDYIWEAGASNWIPEYKINADYDSDGSIIQALSFTWNEIQSTWDNSDKDVYIRNSNYTYNQLLLPFVVYDIIYGYEEDEDIIYYFSTMLTSCSWYRWDSDVNDWALSGEEIFFYSDFTPTTTNNINSKRINIHPNPTSNYFIIDVENVENGVVELFDIQGQKILSHSISRGNRVAIDQLNRGIYVYTLNINGVVYRGKLVVK